MWIARSSGGCGSLGGRRSGFRAPVRFGVCPSSASPHTLLQSEQLFRGAGCWAVLGHGAGCCLNVPTWRFWDRGEKAGAARGFRGKPRPLMGGASLSQDLRRGAQRTLGGGSGQRLGAGQCHQGTVTCPLPWGSSTWIPAYCPLRRQDGRGAGVSGPHVASSVIVSGDASSFGGLCGPRRWSVHAPTIAGALFSSGFYIAINILHLPNKVVAT